MAVRPMRVELWDTQKFDIVNVKRKTEVLGRIEIGGGMASEEAATFSLNSTRRARSRTWQLRIQT